MKTGKLIFLVAAGVLLGLIAMGLIRSALLPQLEKDGVITYDGAEYVLDYRFDTRDRGRLIGKTSFCRVREIAGDPTHTFLYAQNKWYQDPEYVPLARTDADEIFCENIKRLCTPVKVGQEDGYEYESRETCDAAVIEGFVEALFSENVEMLRPAEYERYTVTAENDRFPTVTMAFDVMETDGKYYLELRSGAYARLPEAAEAWLRETLKTGE